MIWSPYPPLPCGTVRDLLGITRALYRTALTAEPSNVARLQALERIGTTLRAVLRSRAVHPGTTHYFNAWAAAERATRELGELVDDSLPLRPLIMAAAGRLSRPGSMG